MYDEDKESKGWGWMMQFVQNTGGILRIKNFWKLVGFLGLRKPASLKMQSLKRPREGLDSRVRLPAQIPILLLELQQVPLASTSMSSYEKWG